MENKKKKNHYFIGYMIRFDKNLLKELDKSKKYIKSLQDVKTKVDLSEVRLTAPSLLLELIEPKEDASVQKIESFFET